MSVHSEPDFQKLGHETTWTVASWSDAWLMLRDGCPNEPNREIIWECVEKLAAWMRPTSSVAMILQATYE